MPDPHQRPRFVDGRAVLHELKGWDKVNKALIRSVLDVDPPMRVRKTRAGHVHITNRFGSTTTIASSGHGRGSQAIKRYEADVRRLLAEHTLPDDSRKESIPVPDEPITSIAQLPPDLQLHSSAISPPPQPTRVDLSVVDLADSPPPPPPWTAEDPPAQEDATVGKYDWSTPTKADRLPTHVCEYCPDKKYRDAGWLTAHRRKEHVFCDVEGCGHWVKNLRGLGPHKAAAHGDNQFWNQSPAHLAKVQAEDPAISRAKRRTRGKKPVEDIALPDEPRDLPPMENPAEILSKVRAALGKDPRITWLEEQLDIQTKRADDAEAQLGLIREAMGLR